MDLKNKKVALIELGASHAECLYSQYKFLEDAGYEITLICNKLLDKYLTIWGINSKIDYFEFGINYTYDWKNLLKIKSLLINSGIKKVIFNSADGSIIRNFLLLHFPKSIDFIGIIHSLEKLETSFSQKLINRKIKKYFVLSDYLKHLFGSSKFFFIESFYPIFFPDFKYNQLKKNSNELWICIPGTIEYYRKDYLGLINQLKIKKVNSNVKFILLGNAKHINSDASDLKLRIKETGIYDNFVFFDGFIPDVLFHSYIKSCDVIMPLFHKSHPFFKEIKSYKISGAFNLAFGYKKPILCEDSFKEFDDFYENGIFYDLDNMIDVINDFSISCEKLDKINKLTYKNSKWNYEFQKNKYVSFIERVI